VVISDKMSNSEWRAFCNAIDQELAPLGPMKRRMNMQLRLMALVFLAVWIVIIFWRDVTATVGGSSFLFYGLGIFIVVVMGILISRMVSVEKAETSRIMENVQRLLNGENGKRSDVSFHIRAEDRPSRHGTTNYIECSVGSTGIPMGGGAATGSTSIPVATPVFTSAFDNLMAGAPLASAPYSSGRSVAERLQELEGIKTLISAKEYSSKTKTILDGI